MKTNRISNVFYPIYRSLPISWYGRTVTILGVSAAIGGVYLLLSLLRNKPRQTFVLPKIPKPHFDDPFPDQILETSGYFAIPPWIQTQRNTLLQPDFFERNQRHIFGYFKTKTDLKTPLNTSEEYLALLTRLEAQEKEKNDNLRETLKIRLSQIWKVPLTLSEYWEYIDPTNTLEIKNPSDDYNDSFLFLYHFRKLHLLLTALQFGLTHKKNIVPLFQLLREEIGVFKRENDAFRNLQVTPDNLSEFSSLLGDIQEKDRQERLVKLKRAVSIIRG